MNNTFTIKNFRVFDEKGASFKFKPITLLTGQNGSGKSSLTKAVMLMHDFLTGGSLNHSPNNLLSQELDFSRPSLKLGGFDVEKNYNSSSETISFGYSVSPKVAEPYLRFDVDYRFRKNESTVSLYNNGDFDAITIRHGQEVILSFETTSLEASRLFKPIKLNIAYTPLTVSFISFCLAINLQRISEMQKRCKDFKGVIIDTEQYSSLDKRKEELLKLSRCLPKQLSELVHLFSNPAFEVVNIQALNEALPSTNTLMLNPDIQVQLEYFLHSGGSFFHFDVFTELDQKTKEEVATLLRNLHSDAKKDIKEDVINDFLNGNYATLSDYFHTLEKEKLSNMASFNVELAIKNNNQEVLQKVLLGQSKSFEKHLFDLLDIKYDSSSQEESDRFQWLYNCLCKLELSERKDSLSNHINCWENKNSYSSRESTSLCANHVLYSAYKEFLFLLIRDVVNPQWLRDIYYLGDAHSNIQRVHSLSDKNDIVVSRVTDYIQTTTRCDSRSVIKKTYPDVYPFDKSFERAFVDPRIKERMTEDQLDKYCDNSFCNYWLSELGIGKKVLIELDKDKMSITLRIVKDEQNNKAVLLADEGYGVYQIVLLLLSIETEIEKLNDKRLSGFGHSYGLFLGGLQKTIILEEPEANLHPAFQASLAHIFYDAYKRSGGLLRFIIETHSEYLIRATQLIVAQQKYKNEEELEEKNPFVVYYIPKAKDAYDMKYLPSGRFARKFGKGFFDAASNLAFGLYEIENS